MSFTYLILLSTVVFWFFTFLRNKKNKKYFSREFPKDAAFWGFIILISYLAQSGKLDRLFTEMLSFALLLLWIGKKNLKQLLLGNEKVSLGKILRAVGIGLGICLLLLIFVFLFIVSFS